MKLKKILLFIHIFTGIASLSSCDPGEALHPTNKCTWVIENCTDQGIIIYSELSSDNHEKKLQPNESYEFIRGGVPKGWQIYFEHMFVHNIANDMVEVKTSDGETILKTWKELELNHPGRQFFNEKFWTKEESQDGRYRIHVWTFKLLPEDLVISENTE